MSSLISLLFISLGTLSPFKPILLLCLFFTVPILSSLPLIPKESADLKIAQFGSINFYAEDYLILLLALTLLVHILVKFIIPKRSLAPLVSSPISKAILIVLAWDIFIGFLSLTKGFELHNVFRKLSSEVIMLVVILIPLMNLREQTQKRLFAYSIILGLILMCSGLIKYFFTGEIEYTSSGTVRTLLGNSVIVLMVPICYLLFYSDLWNRRLFLTTVMLAALSLGISFAGHRSGYLVLLLALMLRYLLTLRYRVQYLWVPAAALLFLGTIVFTPAFFRTLPSQGIFSDAVVRFNDTFNFENKTTQERLTNWQFIFNMLETNPVLGMGRFPVYENLMDGSTRSIRGSSELTGPAHNFVVDKFVHEGLLGLAVTLWFLSVLFRQGQFVMSVDRRFGQFFLVYLLSFIVFCLLNASYSSEERIFLFVIAGIVNMKVMHSVGNGRLKYASTVETPTARRAAAQ
ncbi:MAG TPA: O-antigen ligase family protein [Thermodesulfobacteriota bacterium]|nr:O-antigen ligase family protein [Thermodesulfobacteriota bacterium]